MFLKLISYSSTKYEKLSILENTWKKIRERYLIIYNQLFWEKFNIYNI